MGEARLGRRSSAVTVRPRVSSSLLPGALAGPPPLTFVSMAQKRFALAVTVVLAACSHDSARTVTFGAAGPFGQAYGLANKQGIQLAVDEINASPAWANNRRLSIQFADDSGKGARASAVAQSFVNSPRIVAVVGHVNSGAMLSAAHVYDQLPRRGRHDRDLARADRDLAVGVPRDPERFRERPDDRSLRQRARTQARGGSVREQSIWPRSRRELQAKLRRNDRQHRPDRRGLRATLRALRHLVQEAEARRRVRRRHRRVGAGLPEGSAPSEPRRRLGGRRRLADGRAQPARRRSVRRRAVQRPRRPRPKSGRSSPLIQKSSTRFPTATQRSPTTPRSCWPTRSSRSDRTASRSASTSRTCPRTSRSTA